MQAHKIRVNGKVVNIEAITARLACRDALALEPDAKYAEVLNAQKQVLARFSRKEAGALTMMPTQDGCYVAFEDRYQQIKILCQTEAHARELCRALTAGALRFTSKAV